MTQFTAAAWGLIVGGALVAIASVGVPWLTTYDPVGEKLNTYYGLQSGGGWTLAFGLFAAAVGIAALVTTTFHPSLPGWAILAGVATAFWTYDRSDVINRFEQFSRERFGFANHEVGPAFWMMYAGAAIIVVAGYRLFWVKRMFDTSAATD